tara:strand:+ start:1451 stop:1702 length:252 start_codon:yes stop_codon:yes gene_type:complete
MINFLKLPIIGAYVLIGNPATVESFQGEYVYPIEKTNNEVYIPKNVCTIKDKELLTKQNFKSIVNVCLDIKKPMLLKRSVNPS